MNNNKKDLAKDIEKATENLKELRGQISLLKQDIIKTRRRALSVKHLEQYTWKIWGYCRLNKDSLDSEKHCKIIKDILERAIADKQRECESLAVRIVELEEKLEAAILGETDSGTTPNSVMEIPSSN